MCNLTLQKLKIILHIFRLPINSRFFSPPLLKITAANPFSIILPHFPHAVLLHFLILPSPVKILLQNYNSKTYISLSEKTYFLNN